MKIKTSEIEFVKELYPRLREDDATIEQYRTALDLLPPIVVARGRVLVDGFHRLQAYRRENRADIDAIDLGNLTDVEILKESIRRNSSHGRQLETKDKRRCADQLYRQGVDEPDLASLLSISPSTVATYIREAKSDKKADQQAKAWDLWLDCLTEQAIAEQVGTPQQTINGWLTEKRKDPEFGKPPASRQHFDVWNFAAAADDGTESYFGRLPGQIIENLLWLYTEPGQIIVDPFVGGGTTIDVAKRMGRRIWGSDRKPSTPTLPIHEHDITIGWPKAAPAKADLILLDPPYWQQAKGRYSKDPEDLGNMTLEDFMMAWQKAVGACKGHLTDGGRLAFIVSPAQLDDGGVVDLAFEMYGACVRAGLKPMRRVIATYNTQQATGQQVEWARETKRLLKLYRDLVVMAK